MEQTSGRTTSTPVLFGLILLGGLTSVLSLVADLYTAIEFGSDCSRVPDPEMMRQGRLQLVVIVLLAVTPWLVAWICTGGRRTAVLVIGILAAVPPLVGAMYGLANDSAWTGGLCIPF